MPWKKLALSATSIEIGRETVFMSAEVELFELDTEHARQLARNGANNLIKSGKLERLTWCQVCGTREIQTEAHHDDYHRPKSVIFLCARCHRIVYKLRQSRESRNEADPRLFDWEGLNHVC